MKNLKFRRVAVVVTRAARLTLLVPAGMDESVVARAVEFYYDGMTLYGGGEAENGDAVILDADSVQNDASVVGSEPAKRLNAGAARAARAYWNWAAALQAEAA